MVRTGLMGLMGAREMPVPQNSNRSCRMPFGDTAQCHCALQPSERYDFLQHTRRPLTEMSPRAKAATHFGYNSCSAAWMR